MRNLLWVGDAACDSGFAKCTHNTIPGFLSDADTRVTVLGINYRGDPHEYPYKIYPAFVLGNRADVFGVRRVIELMRTTEPDVVVIQNDPWNIPAYVEQVQLGYQKHGLKRPMIVGAVAIDGKNARGKDLNGLDHCIFWTEFAQKEAQLGGYTGTSHVVPLGVDLNIFSPGDRAYARSRLGLPPEILDGFWVLNANRNQPRKRLDLTLQAFADFYHGGAEDAYLYLHVCPTGDIGYDLDQLGWYYKLKGHLILAEPGIYKGSAEEDLIYTYQAANVQVSTTQGEGWGLTTMEGMACGVPQIVPDWAALGEWAEPAADLVTCTSTIVTPNMVNAIGGVPDREELVQRLWVAYHQFKHRNANPELGESIWGERVRLGLDLVNQPRFRWENIAAAFASNVRERFAAWEQTEF